MASIPAAASASLSPISSVVSDFTFTTSRAPVRGRGRSRSRSPRLRRAPSGRRRRPTERRLELEQVAVEMTEHAALDAPLRPSRSSSQSGRSPDDRGTLRADRRRRDGEVPAELRVAEAVCAAPGTPRRSVARISARCRARTSARTARQGAADLHQARHVHCGDDLGARLDDASILSSRIALDVSAFLTANVPPNPQHSSDRGSSASSRPRRPEELGRGVADTQRREASDRSGGTSRAAESDAPTSATPRRSTSNSVSSRTRGASSDPRSSSASPAARRARGRSRAPSPRTKPTVRRRPRRRRRHRRSGGRARRRR